jgi:transposase
MEMRFFTLPYGVMKICMFTSSPNKVEVMKRLLQMHEAFIKGLLPKPQPSLLAIARMGKWQHGKGEAIRQIAQAEGVTEMTIRRRVQKAATGQPIYKEREPYVHHKHRAIYNEAIRLRRQGLTGLEIAHRLAVPHQTVYHWIDRERLN